MSIIANMYLTMAVITPDIGQRYFDMDRLDVERVHDSATEYLRAHPEVA